MIHLFIYTLWTTGLRTCQKEVNDTEWYKKTFQKDLLVPESKLDILRNNQILKESSNNGPLTYLFTVSFRES